jgi:DHA2 family multidrug resistance protein
MAVARRNVTALPRSDPDATGWLRRIEKLAQYLLSHDHADAAHRAIVAIGKIVRKQAFILAFSDMFFQLGAALIAALIAALLLKKPDRLESGGAH